MKHSPRLLFLTGVGLCLLTGSAFANRLGRVGISRTGCGGLGCHEGGVAPTVTLEGPPALAAGEEAELTLTVAGGQVAAGANISASDGALAVVDDTLQRVAGELTHKTGPIAYTDGRAVYRFLFTAPQEAGSVTVFAAGNSVNDNRLQQGDQWALTELEIQVGGGGGAAGGVGGAAAGGSDDGGGGGGGCRATPAGPGGILALGALAAFARRRRR